MDIERFKANIGSPARPTLFKVMLNFPTGGDNSDKDEFFCKGAQIPTRTIGMFELSYMGRKCKWAGDSSFDDWTVTIVNDNNFTIRNKLERWAELINGARDNISKLYKPEWATDLFVFHLNGLKQTIKTYKFIGCFPTSVGDPIELSWDNNDSPEEYSVTFAVDYWETNTTRGAFI